MYRVNVVRGVAAGTVVVFGLHACGIPPEEPDVRHWHIEYPQAPQPAGMYLPVASAINTTGGPGIANGLNGYVLVAGSHGLGIDTGLLSVKAGARSETISRSL